jgi:hypothetical protein
MYSFCSTLGFASEPPPSPAQPTLISSKRPFETVPPLGLDMPVKKLLPYVVYKPFVTVGILARPAGVGS